MDKKVIWSAGGVVIENNKALICHRKKENLFCLPKGTPEKNESIRDTAVREVSEETGIYPEILKDLGQIKYDFIGPKNQSRYKKNIIYKKTVYFFLMSNIGGSIKNHDEEFDEVVWMSIQNAKEKLTYKDEFSILEKAFHAKYKK